MSKIYDTNPDWAMKAVQDALNLETQATAYTNELEKTAFDLGIGTAAVVGTLLGLGIGAKNKKDSEQQLKMQFGNNVARIVNEQNKKMSDMGSDYYTQMSNLNEDLRVLFTPFSVVYKLKNTVVETISTDSMNTAMKDAFSRRDGMYFKNLLVNKVYLDSQMAEQMFMKRMLEQDKSFKQGIVNKEASEYSDIIDSETPVDIFEISKFAGMFTTLMERSKESDVLDKYASVLLSTYATWNELSIPLDIGPCRYASDLDFDLGIQKLAFFDAKDRSGVNMAIIEPKDLKHNLTVSYLPDRVVFLSNNTVITSLNALAMNEEGYDKFEKRDDRFFKQLFFDMAKNASVFTAEDEQEVLAEEQFEDEEVIERVSNEIIEDVEKIAAVSSPSSFKEEIFNAEDIHPLIYRDVLNKTVGEEWKNWDIEFLDDILRNVFKVENIGDIALNKIMFLITLANSDAPFTGYHTFEKMVRTFNNRSINFTTRESNISLGEIISTLRICQELLKDTDINIYDDISDHVFAYIVEVLAASNRRAVYYNTSMKFEELFRDLLNIELTRYWVGALPNGLTDGNGVAEARTINTVIREVCDIVFKMKSVDVTKVQNSVSQHLTGTVLANELYEDIVTSNVLANYAVNVFLKFKEDIYQEQVKKYVV